MELQEEIKQIINTETKAWDTKDVDLLLSLFHPDFVWVWPKDNQSPNLIDWELPLGKFDLGRWKNFYSEMFTEYNLVRNERKTIEIKVSNEGDGAFAVVDIDTLWESSVGKQMHWLGRTGKTYSKVGGRWYIISHYGPLLQP